MTPVLFRSPFVARLANLTRRQAPLRTHIQRHLTHSVSDVVEAETSSSDALVADTITFLKQDLVHLFDDQGIDASRYDSVVDFQDPVTSYTSIQGYIFNIRLLKNVFSPKFTLHDIRQTGEYEITTRWTMQMKFTPAANTPLRVFWNPQLTFTGPPFNTHPNLLQAKAYVHPGVSIYGINPSNGKINKHIDRWDAIDNQTFPSLEGLIHVLRQLLDISQTPDLETPNYTVLRKTKEYEIRQYIPFLVAETKMSGPEGMASVNPASASGGSAFNQLAGYIFGNNVEKERMEMTTPVFTDTTGNMQFVLGSKFKEATELPTPDVGSVTTKKIAGGVFVCSVFNGLALEDQVTSEHAKLKKSMLKDKLVPGADWILARYNDPFTNPVVRRNEILIPIEEGFSLW